MKAAVPNSTSRAKFPLAPVTQNVWDCRHLEILPGNECLSTVTSQGGWDTTFWGKTFQPFNNHCHIQTQSTEAAELIGSLLHLAQTCPVSQMSLVQLKAAHDVPSTPQELKRTGPSLSSPNLPLAFLGHRVSVISAPANHSLGSSGGRTGTALALS